MSLGSIIKSSIYFNEENFMTYSPVIDTVFSYNATNNHINFNEAQSDLLCKSNLRSKQIVHFINIFEYLTKNNDCLHLEKYKYIHIVGKCNQISKIIHFVKLTNQSISDSDKDNIRVYIYYDEDLFSYSLKRLCFFITSLFSRSQDSDIRKKITGLSCSYRLRRYKNIKFRFLDSITIMNTLTYTIMNNFTANGYSKTLIEHPYMTSFGTTVHFIFYCFLAMLITKIRKPVSGLIFNGLMLYVNYCQYRALKNTLSDIV